MLPEEYSAVAFVIWLIEPDQIPVSTLQAVSQQKHGGQLPFP